MSNTYYFNEEELNYIFNNYQNYTNEELAQCIGGNCTKNHIAHILRSNGIYKRKPGTPRNDLRIFSDADDQFIKYNYLTMAYSKIAEILGFTERQVKGRVCNLHLRKKRKINSKYFKNIYTSLKAYFLGFIFADGWIVYNKENHNYEFGMELQEQDKYILERLNDELGGVNIIQRKEPHDNMINGKLCHVGYIESLRVYSKDLVENLMDNGICRNKSLSTEFPIVSDDLFFDFLRGYIDGDGCYYTYKNNVYMHITCATTDVLFYIQNKLKEFDIETRIYSEREHKNRLMCVNLNEMKKLINKLYYDENVFCLTRKYEKIKHFLGSAA